MLLRLMRSKSRRARAASIRVNSVTNPNRKDPRIMALLTLTVNNLSPQLDHQHQEVALISRALHLAAQDVRSAGGKKTSGNIMDTGGVVLGTWTYIAQASS